MNLILMPFICLASIILLTSCQGVIGMVSCRTEVNESLVVTHIESYGVQLNNVPGHRGVALGRRSSIYVSPRAPDIEPEPLENRLLYMPWKQMTPIHYSIDNKGVELVSEPSFIGFSAGVGSRQVTTLDTRLSQAFLRQSDSHGENFYRYRNYETE